MAAFNSKKIKMMEYYLIYTAYIEHAALSAPLVWNQQCSVCTSKIV